MNQTTQTITSAVIVDDEPNGREMIALLLKQFFPDIEVLGEAGGIAAGISLVNRCRPDIIFLDVEMHDGNAFDLLLACKDTIRYVILATAHEHYALKAIKASVLDYLLKPVCKEDFIHAVSKALKQREQMPGPALVSFSEIYQHLMVRKIRIPTMNGFSTMNIDEIVRCEASGSYTTIICTNHSPITACRTLGKYEEDLKAYGFIRIHNKHLVNPNHIIEYSKGKGGGFITLYGREVLEVSARRRIHLLDALG